MSPMSSKSIDIHTIILDKHDFCVIIEIESHFVQNARIAIITPYNTGLFVPAPPNGMAYLQGNGASLRSTLFLASAADY